MKQLSGILLVGAILAASLGVVFASPTGGPFNTYRAAKDLASGLLSVSGPSNTAKASTFDLVFFGVYSALLDTPEGKSFPEMTDHAKVPAQAAAKRVRLLLGVQMPLKSAKSKDVAIKLKNGFFLAPQEDDLGTELKDVRVRLRAGGLYEIVCQSEDNAGDPVFAVINARRVKDDLGERLVSVTWSVDRKRNGLPSWPI
ncbi:MAG: hypothetical protein P4L33_00660 [Capsulimonadaceae bacterium]|nr:hypothetical protein [Capsulimonadaceae bacterium]